MQILHQQIERNHTAAEIHGKHKIQGDLVPCLKFLSGKRVGTENGHKNVHCSTHKQIEERICKTSQNFSILEYGIIAPERRAHREDKHFPADNCLRIREGCRHHIQQRIQHDHQYQGENEIYEKHKYLIYSAHITEFCCLHIISSLITTDLSL